MKKLKNKLGYLLMGSVLAFAGVGGATMIAGCSNDQVEVQIQQDGIEIISSFKTQYFVGEDVDVTGGIISCTINGKTKQVALTDEMISGFSSATPGTRKLVITYQDLTMTVSYTVSVKDEPEEPQEEPEEIVVTSRMIKDAIQDVEYYLNNATIEVEDEHYNSGLTFYSLNKSLLASPKQIESNTEVYSSVGVKNERFTQIGDEMFEPSRGGYGDNWAVNFLADDSLTDSIRSLFTNFSNISKNKIKLGKAFKVNNVTPIEYNADPKSVNGICNLENGKLFFDFQDDEMMLEIVYDLESEDFSFSVIDDYNEFVFNFEISGGKITEILGILEEGFLVFLYNFEENKAFQNIHFNANSTDEVVLDQDETQQIKTLLKNTYKQFDVKFEELFTKDIAEE